MEFREDTACAFAGWFELVYGAACEQDSSATRERGEDKMRAWFPGAARNFRQVKEALHTPYGLPDLENIRREICFCITMGFWQASVCLTNVLLESFLKRILIYSNRGRASKDDRTMPEMLGTLEESLKTYGARGLYNTIDEARKQDLIDQETEVKLHEIREQFRNAFFHADPEKMFKGQTLRVTEIQLDTSQREVYEDVPLHLFMPSHGDVMWGFAKENAIPYFLYVDHLIRAMIPKVFGEKRPPQADIAKDKS